MSHRRAIAIFVISPDTFGNAKGPPCVILQRIPSRQLAFA
jgi:hypothetical protein